MLSAKTGKFRNRLFGSERLILTITLVTALINFFLIWWKSADVDWPAYAGLVGLALVLIVVGYAYRASKRSERIALAMIGAGMFILFSAMVSLYNYLLLPVVNPMIDPHLTKVDAVLGFHWPDVMAWAAENMMVSNLLKFAYATTMPQIALLVIVLGLTGRQLELHRLLVSVAVSATFAICFWALFPSQGAMSVHEIPLELWNTINPILDLEYTLTLKRIAQEGPGLITPGEIRGLIGFPSYHAVLAFTAIYAARTVPYLFPVFLVVNLLILPSIFIQGGHHLVDLPAGFAVFLIGYYASNYAVGVDYKRRGAPAVTTA